MGRVGAASARDLVKDSELETVGIVGRRKENLEMVQEWINSNKLTAHLLDVSNTEDMKLLMKRYDVGIIALPDRKTSYTTVEAAIEAKLNRVIYTSCINEALHNFTNLEVSP